MTRILQVLVSPRPESFSRRVAEKVARLVAARRPGAEVTSRDLAADPPPHPPRAFYDAILAGAPADDPRFALSERLIGELEAADLVVIGTPMNNFTVPSSLKAWIDYVLRIRRTFRSTPEGKIGLLRDRPLVVISAHGGYCGEAPPAQPDFLTPYLRAVFATMGIHGAEFLRLEGLTRGAPAATQALDRAEQWIGERLPAWLDGT